MNTDPLFTRRVVVGVDASQHAARAAIWVAAEAADRGVPLHIIHALELDPGSALARPGAYGDRTHAAREIGGQLVELTRRRALDAHPSLQVTTELAHEGAAGALVAASHDADLLVTGTRGRGGFAGLALGSVSARVAAHAHCPAVILRAQGHDDARTGEIVLGLQAGESEETILFAFEEAARSGAWLRAVHAWTAYPGIAPDYLSETDLIARTAMERMVQELTAAREKYPEVKVAYTVQRGHPAAVLADASRCARLTVVGAHRHHGPLSLSIGPVIHGLLGTAHCPVAVVPAH